MDLLDSVLRTAKAEKFTEKFKASGIDTATLSLLTNEDLQLLNVEGADTRQNILNCINNLQVPKEYVFIFPSYMCVISFTAACYVLKLNLLCL